MNRQNNCIKCYKIAYSDFLHSLKLTIEASDNRNPAKTDTSTVEITVIRDAFPPTFTNLPGAATAILETRVDTDGPFFTISANDPDLKVSKYLCFLLNKCFEMFLLYIIFKDSSELCL